MERVEWVFRDKGNLYINEAIGYKTVQ